MVNIFFDNGQALYANTSIPDFLELLKTMRSNNKKFIMNDDNTSIINIDRIVYVISAE